MAGRGQRWATWASVAFVGVLLYVGVVGTLEAAFWSGRLEGQAGRQGMGIEDLGRVGALVVATLVGLAVVGLTVALVIMAWRRRPRMDSWDDGDGTWRP